MRWNSYGPALPAFVLLLSTAFATVQAQTQAKDLYVQCSFYPQGKGCDRAYQQALHDDTPAAASVRSAFEYYARYLKPDTGGLTDEDKQYLTQNEIAVPFDFNPADTAGLHNVINDPALAKNPDERRAAVNGFIGRAVQAELYCGTNQCADGAAPATN